LGQSPQTTGRLCPNSITSILLKTCLKPGLRQVLSRKKVGDDKKSRRPGLRLVCDLVSDKSYDKSYDKIDLMEFGLYRAVLVKLSYLTKGHLSLKHSLSVISANITMNIIRRSRSFRHQSNARIRLPVSK